VFKHVVTVMEETEQMVGALGKQFLVARDRRELGYGVPPSAPGPGGVPVHMQGDG